MRDWPSDGGIDWVFLFAWIAILTINFLLWGAIIALGFYAVNQFS